MYLLSQLARTTRNNFATESKAGAFVVVLRKVRKNFLQASMYLISVSALNFSECQYGKTGNVESVRQFVAVQRTLQSRLCLRFVGEYRKIFSRQEAQ